MSKNKIYKLSEVQVQRTNIYNEQEVIKFILLQRAYLDCSQHYDLSTTCVPCHYPLPVHFRNFIFSIIVQRKLVGMGNKFEIM